MEKINPVFAVIFKFFISFAPKYWEIRMLVPNEIPIETAIISTLI